MDKHDRKRLARWESKKAKGQLKFEERIREYWNEPALDKIEAFGNSYKPHPVRVLSGIIQQAEEYLKELRKPPPPSTQRYMMMSQISVAQWILLGDYDVGWFYTMMSSRVHRIGERISEYDKFIVYDERSLDRKIDIPKTIDAIRDHKDNQLRNDCLRGIMRSTIRLDIIREELAAVTRKFNAIRKCHIIKEELMMNVWHPRRVEHILETYGWDVYENLIGAD